MNPHEVTRCFEQAIEDYTGAECAICVDNCSNAIFLSLMYEGIKDKTILLPSHTYMSVPCEVIHAGGRVKFYDSEPMLKGAYNLYGTKTWDSALRFTADMYIPDTFMCCSFTGPNKHLKLGKGGCILTDDYRADDWFRKARFSGRNNVSYHEDTFSETGWNMYMHPMVSALGLLLIQQFYNLDGTKKQMEDISLPYPDLSTHTAYK